jgi:hypothetical protein
MMSKFGRVVLVLAILATVVALPSSALARKQLFKARLTTGAELHQVVDSNARGNATFVARPEGLQFTVAVYDLSGPPTGVQIHAPADETQGAPVVLSLCGNPAPAAIAVCTFDASTNSMLIQGMIGGSLLQQWGLTGAQLYGWLNNGMAYVNVHTALNPTGEVRGQIIAQ